MNRYQGMRLIVLLFLLGIAAIAPVIPDVWARHLSLQMLMSVDDALATCDRIELTIRVHATGQVNDLNVTGPADIESIRKRIDLRNARCPTPFEELFLLRGVSGSGGWDPQISLVAWRGRQEVADLRLLENALRVRNRRGTERAFLLKSEDAYLRFCADAGVKVPWVDW